MKRAIMVLLLATMLLTYGSCRRDHLYYETSRYALIHIEIDWETLSHVSPNGVSTYVFDSNGDKYSDVQLSSDPNNVYLKLPPGDYTVVFHNNSISELGGVHITGSSHLDTFSIHADEADYDPEFDELDEELFVDEPDDVVSYTLHDLHIDASDIEYHYYKPDLSDYEQEVTQTILIQPDHIVHISRIIAYMNGVEYSSTKQPKAVLHGMSGGYYFGAECTSEEDVMEEFDVNLASSITEITAVTKANGVLDILDPDDEDGFSDEELEGMGVAYVDVNTFGMHETDPEDQHYYLYMRFYLYDGTYTDYEIDITGFIDTDDLGTNNLHTVELILSPLPDGDGEPGDGTWGIGSDADGDGSESGGTSGVFDPSLDEWVDVEVSLPM